MATKKNLNFTITHTPKNSIQTKPGSPKFRLANHAPTNKPVMDFSILAKQSPRSSFVSAVVSTPEVSSKQKAGHRLTRKDHSLKYSFFPRRVVPFIGKSSAVRDLVAQSSLVLGSAKIKSSVVFASVESAAVETTTSFKKTRKKLYRPNRKSKQARAFFNPFATYNPHWTRSRAFPVLYETNSSRLPVGQYIRKNVAAGLYNKTLSSFIFRREIFGGLSNLKSRFYSSVSGQKGRSRYISPFVARRKPVKKSKKPKKKLNYKAKRRARLRKMLKPVYKWRRNKPRRLRRFKKLPPRNLFSKKVILCLSKSFKKSSLRVFRRKLLKKRRRAFRPYRGWWRNRFRRVVLRRVLRNSLKRRYAKRRAVLRRSARTLTYLKSSFRPMLGFQQKTKADFFVKPPCTLFGPAVTSSFRFSVKKVKNENFFRRNKKSLKRNRSLSWLRARVRRAHGLRRKTRILLKFKSYLLLHKKLARLRRLKAFRSLFVQKKPTALPSRFFGNKISLQVASLPFLYQARIKAVNYTANRFYKRTFLRRRLRGVLLTRLRGKLRRTAPMTLPGLFVIGQKRNYYSKKIFWRHRKLGKKVVNRLSRSFFSKKSTSSILSLPKKGSRAARFLSLKASKYREVLNAFPRYSLAYRLLFRRWHSRRNFLGEPIPRAWPSRAETRRRARMNLARFRRGLRPKKAQDPVFSELTKEIGSFSSIGYRRIRRSLQLKFNSNRWWKVSALPSPLLSSATSPLTNVLPSSLYLREKTNSVSTARILSAIKTGKRSGLQRASNWKAHSPSFRLATGDSWRAVEDSFLTPLTTTKATSRWSLKYMTSIFKTLEAGPFSELWGRCFLLLGAKGTKRLRVNFLRNSPRWLRNRPFEKKVQKALLKSANPQIVANAKALISLNRSQLFKRSPNWWAEECYRRLRAISDTLDLFQSEEVSSSKEILPWKFMSACKDQIYGETATQRAFSTETEKKAIRAVFSSISPVESSALFKDLFLGSESQPKLTDKSLSTPYKNWLRGIEGYMKKFVFARSSQDHVETRRKNITLLGIDRPRFPGRGRRKSSYDSAVRVFYKKTVSSRFRRVQSFRFCSFRPPMSKNFYARLPSVESSSWTRRSARTTSFVSRSNYLSRQWRKLLTARKQKASLKGLVSTIPTDLKPENALTKRRLASSPSALLFDNSERRPDSLQASPLEAVAETLLLSALTHRTKNRELQELALHSGRRLLPLEQILPPWMLAGKLRKRRKTRGTNSADYVFPDQYDPLSHTYWVTSGFSVSVPRQLKSLDVGLSTTGEIVAPSEIHYKLRRFKSGWTFSRSKKRLRRFRPILKRYKGVCFKKNKKVKNPRYLFRKKRKYRNVRKSRRAVSRAWRGLPRFAVCRLLRRHSKASTRFSYRLAHLDSSIVLAPMLFSKKTREIVISDQEKLRQKEGLALRKQEHYKKTAQLAENFTTMLPQLISLLIERRFAGKALSIKEARAAVHSVYWSIRYYLQTDRTGTRLAARDASLAQFGLLRNQLVRDTEDRHFDLNDLNMFRYRFQPHKLVYSKPLTRGAVDWLRMFFPRYHSLYLEDPEAYKNFFLTPIKAFRAHPSRKNPGEWQTMPIPGLMQNRFKRLTNPNNWQNSSRFESLLMTTRRSPVIVGRGSASRLKSVNFSGSLSPKGSFFTRQYSTSFPLKSAHARDLVLNRISALRRHSISSSRPLADVTVVSKRYTLKARALARGRSSYVANQSETGAGALDTRFSRLKSPRNREFLQRVLVSGSIASTFKRKAFKDALYSRLSLVTEAGASELPRRHVRGTTTPTLSSHWASSPLTTLLRSRKTVSSRRLNTFLRSRATVLKHTLSPFVEKRIFTKKKRALVTSQKTLTVPFWLQPKLKQASETVSFSRSILSYRRARNRSSHLTYSRLLSVAPKGIRLKRSVRNFLNDSGSTTKLARSILRARLHRAGYWYKKKSLKRQLEKTKKPVQPVKFYTSKVTVASRVGQRRLRGSSLKYRFLSFLPFLKKTSKATTFRMRGKFTSRARPFHHNKKHLSTFLANQENLALENQEATGREELWNAITLRWMKKRRVLKNWLKDAKRGLKKDGWDLMPEIIFKGMRSRLRKLEWREPDLHFNREGFRNAFRFFPGERRRASWLEKLMYRRALYSTLRGSYRRYQFPREQKRLKWLQQYRKAIFPTRRSARYLKRRRWPKLRIYNQRLFRGMFSFRNKRTAQRHFQKLNRRKPTESGFSKALTGLGDRLDVNLVLLNIAPTIFWAKVLAAFGVFRVNNKIVKDPAFRFKKNDRIYWNWVKIERLRICFKPALRKYEKDQQQSVSSQFPKNFDYFPGIRTAIYKRLPTPEDLRKNSRLSPFLFRMFRADSVSGK